jgi:hypothetical protein
MTNDTDLRSSPWLTVIEAAKRARCGVKLIDGEVRTDGSGRRVSERAASCDFEPIGWTNG